MNSPSFELPSEPPVVAPPPKSEPRNYLGWILLLAIFSFLIGQELVQYLDRREPTSQNRYSSTLTQLRMAIQLREGVKSLGSNRPSNADDPILDVAKEVEKEAPSNEIAARIYAAARSELGKDISPKILERLKKSKEPRDPVFAEVFAAKKLTKERAQEIETSLKKGGFISQLATAQAFEKAGDSSRRQELFPPGKIFVMTGVILLAVGAAFVGFVLLVIYLVMKLSKKLPNQGMPLERITLADADRLAIRTAQLLAIFMAVPLLMGQIGIGAIGRYPASFVVTLFVIVGVLSVFGFPIFGRTFSLRDIGISKDNLGKNIAWGFGMALANLPLVLLMGWLGTWLFSGLPKPEHPISSEIASGGMNAIGIFVTLFAASVGAPIIEEIMFRGSLLPALSRLLKAPVIAILIQGLIFAAIHPTGIPAWFALGTIGAMSGFLSRQTGSLVPSIVMHAVHNFGTMMVALAMTG